MKKIVLLLLICLGVSFATNAQVNGKYQAEDDIPSLKISKGDIIYISFTKNFGNIKKAISFENMSNLTSFIAKSTGGMGGFRNGYNFAFYDIDKDRNVKIRYNSKEVKISNYTFTKIRD